MSGQPETTRFTRLLTDLRISPRYRGMREVFWFAVITLSIHFAHRFWNHQLDYWPVKGFMTAVQDRMTGWVFAQSLWINRDLLHIPMQVSDMTMTFSTGSWILINNSCAGDKQILQFALLLIIYPGNWKRKLWYIPVGMVVIHFTNILRIVLLSQVSVHCPEWWYFAHNTVLRGLFYIVILALWILWVERVNVPVRSSRVNTF